MKKRYLGDAVYVDFDGYSLKLATEDGMTETNIIWMEPDVYAALVQYVNDLKTQTAKGAES